MRRFETRTIAGWLLLAVLALGVAGAHAAEVSLAGHWEGTIEVPGTQLAIDLDFALAADGSYTGDISIPVQQIRDRALAEIALDGREATFRIVEMIKAIVLRSVALAV